MIKKPLISVVIPTYNRKEVIGRAVESVLNQSYQNLELLVVDDGSSDGTYENLIKFEGDSRFFYEYQDNKGQSAARNRAITLASGDLIAFLDSDNYWSIDKLSLQLEFWRGKESYDILYSFGYPVNLEGKILKQKRLPKAKSGLILSHLIFGNFITNNTVLVPKRCFNELGGFDEKLRIAEDYDLWLRFATRYRFLNHPAWVSYYTIEGERLSAQEEWNIKVNFQILRRFFFHYPDQVAQRLQRKALANLLIWQTESRWNSGVLPPLPDIFHAVTCNPFERRAWKHFAKILWHYSLSWFYKKR